MDLSIRHYYGEVKKLTPTEIESAYNAGVDAEHKRAVSVVAALTKHIEDKQRIDQHSPYSARELYEELFSMADGYIERIT